MKLSATKDASLGGWGTQAADKYNEERKKIKGWGLTRREEEK